MRYLIGKFGHGQRLILVFLGGVDMSKYNPYVSQEERIKIRDWRDGDICMINGRTSIFHMDTGKWEVINSLPASEWLNVPLWEKAQYFRADGTVYTTRGGAVR
jgi:hypothetical protein